MKKFLTKLESKIDSTVSSSSTGPPVSAAPVPDLRSPPSSRQVYYHRKQYGVNLGSWFTLESWLTGSLFQGAKDPKDSEMDLLLGVGPEQAKQLLERHWDGFMNDGDWKWMSFQGINTVRLPISYYHFLPGSSSATLMDGTEYEKFSSAYTGAWPRIQQAIQTAASYNIGVLIDLHSAPGAQNTDGHSGLSSHKAGLWDSSRNQRKTIAILEALANEVARYDNVVGLELLNEPKNSNALQGFYEDAIRAIRKQGGPAAQLPLYLGDAWDLNHYAGWVSKQANAGNFLVVDHHLYRCFSKEDHSTPAMEHAKRLQPGGGRTHNMLSGAANTLGGSLIIGEWSAALNPGSLHGQSQGEAQKAWGQAQVASYPALVAGTFFWTLKKEGHPDSGWNLYSAVEQGVIPSGLGRPRQAPGDLDQREQQAGSQAFESHANYWNSNGGTGDHSHFSEGFRQGWQDARFFWQQAGQSQIGFSGQWAKTRAEAWKRQGGAAGTAWEYEHGCRQAIDAFNQFLRG